MTYEQKKAIHYLSKAFIDLHSAEAYVSREIQDEIVELTIKIQELEKKVRKI